MTAPEFRYPFRLRDAFQDTRNNTELEIFLNTFAVLKDENGDVSIDGDLNLGGVFTGVGAVYNRTPQATVTLTAAANTYQAVRTLTLGKAGHYMVYTNCYIESSTGAIIWYWGALGTAGAGGVMQAWMRTRQESGAYIGQLSPAGLIIATSDAMTLTFAIQRSSTSGTQLAKHVSIHAVRVV